MFGVFKAVERWASQSDARMRLAVISIWIGFGLLVIGTTMGLAWVMLPSDYSIF